MNLRYINWAKINQQGLVYLNLVFEYKKDSFKT